MRHEKTAALRREYFDSHYSRLHHESAHGEDDLLVCVFLVGIAAVLFVLVCLTGCAGGGGDLVAAAVATGAKPGGVALGSAVALENASSGSGWLTALGGLVIVAGGVCVGHPQGPSGLGFGLLLAGACLLLAGAVLPLLAGWVGLVALVGVVGAFLAQKAGLFDRLKNLLPKTPITLPA